MRLTAALLRPQHPLSPQDAARAGELLDPAFTQWIHERRPHEGEDRVRITLDGTFLPYARG